MLPEPGWTYYAHLHEESPHPHLWVVLTAPADHEEDLIVVVPLTTKQTWTDPTVEIGPEEHPFVEKPTAVRYSNADFYPPQRFIRDVLTGEATRRPNLSDELLERIRRGLLESPQTPERVREFCELLFTSRP